MMASHRRVFPSSLVNPVIGRAFAVRPDAEQRAECIERIEPAIKAERELIEIGLQVLRLDAAMVRPLKPRLQVRKNEVDNRQIFFRDLGIISLDHRQVRIAALGKRIIRAPSVRDDHRTGLDCLFHETAQRLGGAIGNDFST